MERKYLTDIFALRVLLRDIGAPSSFIVLPQARANCHEKGIKLNSTLTNNYYSFGSQCTKATGNISIIIPTRKDITTIQVDLFPEHLRLFIGLDTMENTRIEPLAVERTLSWLLDGWKMTLMTKHEHLNICLSLFMFKIFYIRPQLKRLQRRLLHQATRELYERLRCATSEDLTSDNMSTVYIKIMLKKHNIFAPPNKVPDS